VPDGFQMESRHTMKTPIALRLPSENSIRFGSIHGKRVYGAVASLNVTVKTVNHMFCVMIRWQHVYAVKHDDAAASPIAGAALQPDLRARLLELLSSELVHLPKGYSTVESRKQ